MVIVGMGELTNRARRVVLSPAPIITYTSHAKFMHDWLSTFRTQTNVHFSLIYSNIYIGKNLGIGSLNDLLIMTLTHDVYPYYIAFPFPIYRRNRQREFDLYMSTVLNFFGSSQTKQGKNTANYFNN